MKKFISFLTVFTVIAAALFQPARAECTDYYIMRKKNHERPTLEPGMAYMSDYNGYYIGADEKVIYLTFDAGYENGNVERIVDTLDRHNAKGTFFVLDNIIRRDTDLIMKMAEHGHTVANHSMHHKNMTNMSYEDIEKELVGLASEFKAQTGKNMSKFFRPPEGKVSRAMMSNLCEMGYKTIFWSFAYADWDNNKQPSEEYAIKLILENTHNGEIILLHPTSKTNADILDRLLCEWEKMGYRFGTLDEL